MHADHSAAAAHYQAQAQRARAFCHGARVSENDASITVMSRTAAEPLEMLTIDFDGAQIEVLYSFGSEDEPAEVVGVEVSGYWFWACEVFDDATRAAMDEAALKVVKARGRSWL